MLPGIDEVYMYVIKFFKVDFCIFIYKKASKPANNCCYVWHFNGTVLRIFHPLLILLSLWQQNVSENNNLVKN